MDKEVAEFLFCVHRDLPPYNRLHGCNQATLFRFDRSTLLRKVSTQNPSTLAAFCAAISLPARLIAASSRAIVVKRHKNNVHQGTRSIFKGVVIAC